MLQNLVDRQILRADAEWTLREPEATDPARGSRRVHMRRFSDVTLGEEMLLLLIVEETQDEVVVVTAYKTSRISKYLGGPT